MLAIVHGLWRSGAQEATLAMLTLLKRRGVDLNVLTSQAADRAFLSEIEDIGISVFKTPHKTTANYPDLMVETYAELIRSSDLVWITDVEYLVAPRIKRIKKEIPVVAHLHSYAVACPIWSAFYGMREVCMKNCSPSLRRFAKCKQLATQYRASSHQKSTRMKVYQLLNFPKSWLDFVSWPMNETIVENIDGFVAVSSYTRDLVRVHLPQLKHAPVEVIHNPIMVSEPHTSSKSDQDGSDETILYASGTWINKGPHIALYAFKKLLDESSKDVRLVMLGTEDNAWIKDLVRRLGLESHVKLLPRLPSRSLVFEMMASSTVVLLPSLWPEPFATVPIEANLLGTPAVVSNRGGLPDTIVDKVTGLIAEPSVEAVAKTLEEALRTDWNRELIARTAKERFDPERTVDHLTRFLESFTNRPLSRENT